VDAHLADHSLVQLDLKVSTMQFGIAYIVSAAVLLILDGIWLSATTSTFYRPQLGDLLSEKPSLAVAAVFYLVYVVGVVVFAVMPAYAAKSWLTALGLGALLGLIAYGTYDVTNLATIKGWPVMVSVVDLAWGVVVTATASVAGFAALRTFGN
jgi:uncharacterized membrane protein